MATKPPIHPNCPAKFNDIDALARTLWGEARGEGIPGMVAVACVVVNRVNIDLGNDGKPDWWGEGIESICRARFQFSCWNPNDPNRALMMGLTETGDRKFVQARVIAELAASGLLVDITGGATHYHAAGVTPAWKDGAILTLSLGRHRFYKGVR